MTTKATLHHLVDELPESELETAAQFLERLRDNREYDPVRRALDEAPEDDEPLTPEDEAAIEESRAQYRRGEYVSAEEAKRELLG